ncbi:LacI family DNA-binding transcriptional regulator [Lentzea sp. BCCO 10_0856]|uniref:LacI family DNA-binding transcriptional regulator n=1 Tax=Lentzea miocenica TaxID=3095431 RepID=A0ABU4TAT8_9PSEU|nr:LacI family DNA-binding transcriptional regulator [Lentzea sp. BCCO 10_0856]MDX8035276.1 LacI family DNA-binding transcriptional regulator [Lentzea sp. BCCO 10_0856]
MTRRPGIDEVAALAGVSKSTVSRVLNGAPHVSTRTREAVRRAVIQLGYAPNQAARSLAGHRANAIALVVSETTGRVLADPFVAGVMRGVHAELAGRRTQLVLMMSRPGDVGSYLTGGHVDGALVISMHGHDPLLSLLHDNGLPVVAGGRPLAGGPVPYVDSDNFTGAVDATRHLISLGCGRIATIAGPTDMAVGLDRLSGWRRAMSGRRTDLVAHGDFTAQGGASAMTSLLTREPELDAVFVAADIMALGALQVLNAHGRRVPEDVAVVGFDDSVPAVPPLTTVRQDVERFGRMLMWRLLAEIEGEEGLPPSVLLPTSLVLRTSA